MAPSKAISNDIELGDAETILARCHGFLRLPKAYRWVCCEFFWSDIDRACLKKNEFEELLSDLFPTLWTRNMRKAEWSKIRRVMGKPRRLSAAFLLEERETLHELRGKIRLVQRRVLPDGYISKELPDEIPLRYVIGMKVSAWIREGLHVGKVTAADPSNHTYRIKFNKERYGVRSVEDFCIMSEEGVELMKVSSLALKLKLIWQRGSSKVAPLSPGVLATCDNKKLEFSGNLGGYPVQFLDMIVRLNRFLQLKMDLVNQLKDYNGQAEKLVCFGKRSSHDFRLNYSLLLVKLKNTNVEITALMDAIKGYIDHLMKNADGKTFQGMIDTKKILEDTEHDAATFVKFYNGGFGKLPRIRNANVLTLIKKLTSLMLRYNALKTSSNGERQRYPSECSIMFDTMSEIKSKLCGQNVPRFQDVVELPIRSLIAGLCLPVSPAPNQEVKPKC